MKDNQGKIVSVKGHVIEVRFPNLKPSVNNVLILEDDPDIKMEVYSSSGKETFYCLGLTSTDKFYRGAIVIDTNKPVLFPVSGNMLGRAVDIFGKPYDSLGELKSEKLLPVRKKPEVEENINLKQEILETGIKVVDLFSPLVKGGKMGLFGGAGVGKTVFLTEVLHNVVGTDQKKGISVFAGG